MKSKRWPLWLRSLLIGVGLACGTCVYNMQRPGYSSLNNLVYSYLTSVVLWWLVVAVIMSIAAKGRGAK